MNNVFWWIQVFDNINKTAKTSSDVLFLFVFVSIFFERVFSGANATRSFDYGISPQGWGVQPGYRSATGIAGLRSRSMYERLVDACKHH